jgi:DNA (cytosine-5)-methyltransferase 1
MDTTPSVTHLGLCAGYGGIELGLHRAIPNMRTIALCEIEAFAIANLVSKMEAGLMDPAPIWPDLKTFPWAAFRGRVDILTGGYPCQPFSAAGQRKGKQDPRHLWPFIADGIRLLRPRCCFFENVEGHISLGLSDVIEDLAGMGYRTTWGIFSASECGAPHQRKRVFILAHKLGTELEGLLHHTATERRQDAGGSFAGCCQPRGEAWPSRPGEQQYGWEPPRVVGNSAEQRSQRESCGEFRQSGQEQELERSDGENTNHRQTQPPLGGDADGSASGLDYAELCITCDNRTDELRLLGNGVVPATAALAFRTLLREVTSK